MPKKRMILYIITALIILSGAIYYKAEKKQINESLNGLISDSKVEWEHKQAKELLPESFEANNQCEVDDDCSLVNKNLECPYCDRPTDLCSTIDYNKEEYVAVNLNLVDEWRLNNCPTIRECLQENGKMPSCNPQSINTQIKAKCIEGTCKKITQ